MGIVKNGMAQGFSGTVGELVFSQRKGKATVVRLRPKASDKPATSKQLTYRQVTSFCAGFMRPFKDFVKIGFDFQAKRDDQNPYNAMVSELRSSALNVTPAGIVVDFSKLLVTKGEMESPRAAAVSLTATGFAFTWNTAIKTDKEHYSDQVMLLAYFPNIKAQVSELSGARREKMQELLPISPELLEETMHVYIAFCAEIGNDVSNSVYLGQIN